MGWRGAAMLVGVTLVAGCSLLYAPDDDLSGAKALDAGVAAPETGPTPKDAGPDPLPRTDADVATTPAYVAAVLVDKPVLYLRLGEALLRDEVSGSLVATRSGDVGSVPGAVPGDTALDFRKGSLVLGDRLTFLAKAAYTIELWASFRSGNKFGHIVTKQRRTDDATKDGYALFLDGDHLGFERYAAGSGNVMIGDSVSLDAFHHVVATYDGARMKLFVDGKLQKSQNDGKSLATVTEPLIVGCGDTEGNNAFSGVLDELAIYDKVLDEARIAAHLTAAK